MQHFPAPEFEQKICSPIALAARIATLPKPLLAAIAKVQPERVVYVSCNPASLARDLAFMEQHGYKAIVAQPVDMFPMTSHVECVTLLTRS